MGRKKKKTNELLKIIIILALLVGIYFCEKYGIFDKIDVALRNTRINRRI